MTRCSSVALVVCGVLLGCAKSSKPAQESTSSKPSKAERCKRIAQTAGRQAGLVLGLTAAALDEDASAKDSVRDARGAADAAAKEFETKCLDWSDEAVDCLADPMHMALHQSRCEEAVAEAFGHALPPKDVPVGPSPKWSFRFSAAPTDLLVMPSSTVVARIAHTEFPDEGEPIRTEELVGVRAGKQAWRRPGRHAPTLTPGRAGEVIVVLDGALVAIAADDGSEQWTWRPSKPASAQEWMSEPSIKAVARDGDGVLVADGDARMYTIGLDGSGGRQVHAFEDESMDSDARLFAGADGLRWLWEGYELRAFDEAWAPVAWVGAHDVLTDVHFGKTQTVLMIDEELISIDARACGAGKVAPSGWPHPNTLRFGDDDDECPDCAPPPRGCVRWQTRVPDISASPIAAAEAGRLFVNDDEALLGIDAGTEVWKTGIAVGKQLARSGNVYAVVVDGDDGGPTALWKLDADDGTPQWSSRVAEGDGSWMYSVDDVQLAASQTLLVAGFGAELVAFEPG